MLLGRPGDRRARGIHIVVGQRRVFRGLPGQPVHPRPHVLRAQLRNHRRRHPAIGPRPLRGERNVRSQADQVYLRPFALGRQPHLRLPRVQGHRVPTGAHPRPRRLLRTGLQDRAAHPQRPARPFGLRAAHPRPYVVRPVRRHPRRHTRLPAIRLRVAVHIVPVGGPPPVNPHRQSGAIRRVQIPYRSLGLRIHHQRRPRAGRQIYAGARRLFRVPALQPRMLQRGHHIKTGPAGRGRPVAPAGIRHRPGGEAPVAVSAAFASVDQVALNLPVVARRLPRERHAPSVGLPGQRLRRPGGSHNRHVILKAPGHTRTVMDLRLVGAGHRKVAAGIIPVEAVLGIHDGLKRAVGEDLELHVRVLRPPIVAEVPPPHPAHEKARVLHPVRMVMPPVGGKPERLGVAVSRTDEARGDAIFDHVLPVGGRGLVAVGHGGVVPIDLEEFVDILAFVLPVALPPRPGGELHPVADISAQVLLLPGKRRDDRLHLPGLPVDAHPHPDAEQMPPLRGLRHAVAVGDHHRIAILRVGGRAHGAGGLGPAVVQAQLQDRALPGRVGHPDASVGGIQEHVAVIARKPVDPLAGEGLPPGHHLGLPGARIAPDKLPIAVDKIGIRVLGIPDGQAAPGVGGQPGKIRVEKPAGVQPVLRRPRPRHVEPGGIGIPGGPHRSGGAVVHARRVVQHPHRRAEPAVVKDQPGRQQIPIALEQLPGLMAGALHKRLQPLYRIRLRGVLGRQRLPAGRRTHSHPQAGHQHLLYQKALHGF